MLEGFNLRFKRELQIQQQTLKVIRWSGWMTYVMNRNPKRKMLKPEDLLQLHDDYEDEKKKLVLPTKKEMEEIKGWLKK